MGHKFPDRHKHHRLSRPAKRALRAVGPKARPTRLSRVKTIFASLFRKERNALA